MPLLPTGFAAGKKRYVVQRPAAAGSVSEHHAIHAITGLRTTYICTFSLPPSQQDSQARQGRDRREDVKTLAKNSDEWAHFTWRTGGRAGRQSASVTSGQVA